MRLFAILNPSAGGGRGLMVLPHVRKALNLTGVAYDIRLTEGKDHGRMLAGQAVSEGYSRIMCVGGDGLANEVLNGIVGTGAEMALVRAGSGNDLGTVLGIPRDIGEAIRLAATGAAVPLDIASVNGRYYFEIAGAGFDSLVTERANAARHGGRHVYACATLRTLFGFKPARFVVTTAERVIETTAMMVAVGNGPSYGGGMRIVPEARHDDGLLSVCIVKDVSIPHFLMIFPRVFNGSHVRSEAVTIFRATSVHIDADREFPIFADGEFVGVLPGTFAVHARAIPVVAPAYAPMAPVLKPAFAKVKKAMSVPSSEIP